MKNRRRRPYGHIAVWSVATRSNVGFERAPETVRAQMREPGVVRILRSENRIEFRVHESSIGERQLGKGVLASTNGAYI
jgi:hypothetical protein